MCKQKRFCLLIENRKKVLDKKRIKEAVEMNLSKVFDKIKHDLFIARCYVYGFNKEALKLLHNYFSNIWHRTKINKQFTSWQKLIPGVLQGCVLGPLRFNICLRYVMSYGSA